MQKPYLGHTGKEEEEEDPSGSAPSPATRAIQQRVRLGFPPFSFFFFSFVCRLEMGERERGGKNNAVRVYLFLFFFSSHVQILNSNKKYPDSVLFIRNSK